MLTLLLVLAVPSQAAPQFRTHAINPDSTYSACAAVDVSGDGRLDIVCGGWWYEAPQWRRHFLREVEQIRGRFDDYSNLPLDVNGDGRLDLVSANYRSQTLYWVEQPAGGKGPWTRHVVDRPGSMETGRLADVDGDGRLDVLPNGVRFAAWWEVEPGDPPRWIRHELPQQAAGHGIGWGDINGDGRRDIVSTNGYLAAPADRRNGRWTWHGEFRLHRDGSIPLLVLDVDDDGDADIVWGRGHDIGLYWLEQRSADPPFKWHRHVIDTSWSQPHSLLLADVDGDGRDEVVAGKRYLGHDGKDPGELDPLVVYWYRWRADGTWQRGEVSSHRRAGFGLDPKAVDLDGDGDVDLLGAGRSGLYWFENLGAKAAGRDPEDSGSEPPPRDHRQLLTYRDAQGQNQPVKSAADWCRRRAEVLRGMQQAMGPLPDSSRRPPVDMRVESRDRNADYDTLRISYQAEPGDRVPAYLLMPLVRSGRAPAMLCLHQTAPIGKGEPTGLGGRPTLHYAHELARRGYVCLAPDYPSFGDYDYDFPEHAADYASGSMKAVWNNIRAVDLLESLPQVDADRIGCIGHSLGGHNSLFTAVFDQRLRAVVTSCGFTAFHHYYGGDLKGWTSDRYMPRIRDRYGNDPDRVPFDFHEVLGAIAPRPLFINAPLHDSNFDVQGVRQVVDEAAGVYRLYNAAGSLVALHPDSQHDFPDQQRQAAYEFLDEHLK